MCSGPSKFGLWRIQRDKDSGGTKRDLNPGRELTGHTVWEKPGQFRTSSTGSKTSQE